MAMEQTNLYAAQMNFAFCTDLSEIEQYLGILLKMGLVHLSRYAMYWSSELRVPAVADVMNRNRFSDLRRFLHFNDNSKISLRRVDEGQRLRLHVGTNLEILL